MNETLFYVLGIGLTVLAVLISAIGLRFERFPGSRPVLIVGTTLFACLVVATATFGWLNAEDEQAHREEELAHAAEENLASGDEQEAQEEIGSGVAEETAPGETAAVDGAAVFEASGCGGCHTLADAGTTATTGPALDGALEGRSPAYIEEAIVDPNAQVAEGFLPNVMPQTYGEELSPEELDALVQYLAEATSAKG